ncbi:hypothetical protein TELCIR_13951 [Teladorsagia circumcincta]|uniref:Serpentine receptor class gamma n=1 Tax=Teladorsagia circumcincta TaxID=45464 RepID=A0A2G9U409_TELCI|nr:hypothetical protein TELCIR_13951 [Teladorsagia circumcincta]
MYEYRIYVRFIYCIPSCILYVFVLIALFKEHRGVSGRFYSLLIVQALLNVIVFVNSFYVVQMANITNESNWWSGIYNRTPLLITSINSRKACSRAPYFYSTLSKMNMGRIMNDLFIFLTVLLVATSLVNCVSFILLFIRSKRYNDNAERNMFILAFLDFLIQVTFYILFALIYKRADHNGVTDFLVPYASDVVTFSNAYLLIILNKKIRQRVSILVKCRGTSSKPSILVTSFPLASSQIITVA